MMVSTRRALLVAAAVALAACASPNGDDEAAPDTDGGDTGEVPTDCAAVDVAVSSEKIELLTELARRFNDSDEAQVDGECIAVRVAGKASGAAMTLLEQGWDPEVEGPQPVIWSPAASSWAAVLNHRLEERGEPAMAPRGTSFMLTPLVIAMPQPMAEALGWPDEPLGFTDVFDLARENEGWAAYDQPQWGAFRLGKTNPNFSTSGLSALIAQAYAATGKTSDLSLEDLRQDETAAFAEAVESAVVHYGDITLTFMNNWYRADQRGNPYSYVSAVAVEEKSVIDYNRGDPDGVRQEGEEPRPPRVPLVAIYPEEGTVYSDNPLIVLDAPWVDDTERAGAERFVDYVQQPDAQREVLDFGFRPGNPAVEVGDPISAEYGVDPNGPQAELEVPAPDVLARLLDDWQQQRKSARVLLLFDVSGSMGDTADPATGATRLDLAKAATIDALGDFSDDDEIGLWTFSTELGPQGDDTLLELVPIDRAGDVREEMAAAVRNLVPVSGTPLYDVTQSAYQEMSSQYDPSRINAIVLLTDGQNQDGDSADDQEQLAALRDALSAQSEGSQSQAVRVFPIGFGSDADLATLRSIAEASQAAAYDSSDPTSISKVFIAVVSNF
jgi:Ca-activated chloride channel homolog